MKRHILAGALLALIAGTAHAEATDPGPDAPVAYDLRFDNAAHHEAQIAVTYRDLKPGPITFRMARSSPGRYAIHEFAKNVYSVTAVDGAGKTLPITRRDPYSWTVADHDGAVTIRYTLYGDRGDGTYAQIDPTHAHLNAPATFMWAVGYDDRPIRVTFHPLRPDWKIATQLPPAAGTANTFWAPNFQYLMDSPTELSDFALREWQVPGPDGKAYTFRLAIHTQDDPAAIDRFTDMAKAVVAQHNKVFGAPPPLDFGTYTFIADYMPQISGDGMEHRNSTMISQPRSLKAANFAQIDTLSHEYIHAWNVERLRPRGLEPFDYTQADSTRSLWFAEGFTQYYGPLLIHRAGESSLDDYLEGLGATLDYVVNAPGRAYGSPQEMSLRAPFVDAATAIDPVNGTIFTSYYHYGAMIALALDMTLRERYDLTLDAYMRHMWQRNGAAQVDYAPAKPYTPEDLQAGLAELTKDAAFAKAFFDASIRGSALPDFAPLLAHAGLIVRAANPQQGWLGANRVASADGKLTLDQIPLPDSPLYKAGIDKGDVLLRFGGTTLATADSWTTAIGALKPGQDVKLVYRNRAGERTATLKAVTDPTLEVVATEAVGGTLTPAQQAFRTAWLGEQ
ncbi:M61 family metallopeptidase [Hephaestia sp. GCM10023244]|uniref:M61 family metallopeptidase n=1 Tax=unclassified Hephaestia TaxID=2631281 RepID=UPI0020772969|nr:PDZ domain-containing protein [Hephaestia sp. MAHUQ-44]MCM8729549.1 PDZ domain-containing protein [Hephaestia sp. MAHUQ-44]